MSFKKKKYLYLLRHAKAEKGWAGLDDMDRPLHPIGVDEASRISNHVRRRFAFARYGVVQPFG